MRRYILTIAALVVSFVAFAQVSREVEVTKQYGRYVKHVIPYVGGIRYEEIRQGDGKASGKHYIDKEYQKKAMLWLVN